MSCYRRIAQFRRWREEQKTRFDSAPSHRDRRRIQRLPHRHARRQRHRDRRARTVTASAARPRSQQGLARRPDQALWWSTMSRHTRSPMSRDITVVALQDIEVFPRRSGSAGASSGSSDHVHMGGAQAHLRPGEIGARDPVRRRQRLRSLTLDSLPVVILIARRMQWHALGWPKSSYRVNPSLLGHRLSSRKVAAVTGRQRYGLSIEAQIPVTVSDWGMSGTRGSCRRVPSQPESNGRIPTTVTG